MSGPSTPRNTRRGALHSKGNPPGFVIVLDEAIPDRLGNNRLDTFESLLIHPDVGLFFLIPGNGDILRVSGQAQIIRDNTLRTKLAVNGKAPNLVLVVTVEEAVMHSPTGSHCRRGIGTSRITRTGFSSPT